MKRTNVGQTLSSVNPATSAFFHSFLVSGFFEKPDCYRRRGNGTVARPLSAPASGAPAMAPLGA
jgi:hypothetical protein